MVGHLGVTVIASIKEPTARELDRNSINLRMVMSAPGLGVDIDPKNQVAPNRHMVAHAELLVANAQR